MRRVLFREVSDHKLGSLLIVHRLSSNWNHPFIQRAIAKYHHSSPIPLITSAKPNTTTATPVTIFIFLKSIVNFRLILLCRLTTSFCHFSVCHRTPLIDRESSVPLVFVDAVDRAAVAAVFAFEVAIVVDVATEKIDAPVAAILVAGLDRVDIEESLRCGLDHLKPVADMYIGLCQKTFLEYSKRRFDSILE